MSDLPEKRSIMKDFKAEAFSIPNLLSWFRLLLIPVFIVQYMNGEFLNALLTLAVSGLSDVLDGRIARKYNMVTDVGKVLDPIADKLTQCAMIFCVATRFPAMWILLIIHITKELIMLAFGYYVLKKTDTVNSAKWYGKLCTGVMYAVMMLHVVMPELSVEVSNGLIFLCAALIIMSFVMYSLRYIEILKKQKEQTK